MRRGHRNLLPRHDPPVLRYHMDRRQTLTILITLAAIGMVAATPAVEAAPPNIGGDCGFFHWHNGNLLEGELPGYHYHHCY